MYAAYQSGQFSSRCPPVRFSCSPCAAEARRSAFARSARRRVRRLAFHAAGNRSVISCSSHSLPSGSLNVANEE
jgi:hypothetical protein